MIDARVTPNPLDIAAETARLVGADEGAGALATFVGQVRGGGGVTHVELEHHPEITPAALDAITDAAKKRWNLSRALIVHRIGRMGIGEPIVFVAAVAPHRRAALDACAYMIDVLKTQAPFWKKEIGDGVARWIEPTNADHAATAARLERKDAPCPTT